MKVTLLHHTPLKVMERAIRTCYDTHSKAKDEVDTVLIDKVVNKYEHSSVAEHISFNFCIEGIPRYVLQELARHRMASLSVKSSRYTLKELMSEEPFVVGSEYDFNRADKYIYLEDNEIPALSVEALEKLRAVIATKRYSQDQIKPLVPECYLTNLTWTINARSLKNFLKLRTGPRALSAIRSLAWAIYFEIPDELKFLFENDIPKGREKYVPM